ncbi:MAG TPA: acyl transferase, partial [Chitinophagales bacterium]|nr:acyl transferase [Chitinophagales bacterium]
MQNIAGLIQNLFDGDEQSFHSKTLAIFRFQAENCAVYKEFLQYLDIQPATVTSIEAIPFLPITLFKSRTVLIDGCQPDFYFESSGTTQMERSKHFVPDLTLYEKSFRNSFHLFYGDVKQYCIAALLP